MALSLKMTEDTERLEKREKCLEFLRKHKVDVGLTSSASGRSFFLLESCQAAFDGNMSGTVAGMEGCGQRGADGIREYIDGGIGPPNAPVTLSGGWIYNRVAKKGVLVSGKAGAKPMFDTGALYNDFDYEITSR